ncbi:MAG: S-methyl-5-thioribose-1-phosphate isomerase [Caldilineaceae bacterium]|nr:S-methyl-5-thioribose-1-phosphate isomerase [Caldilineaceae bacterium]HRJ43633.1 S-methyl-5-thioribose-1-phosphate isomerase [Caldilineaceae bacterium]
MRTVFWEDDKVKMIDQRLLPGEFVIAQFDTVAGVARSINEMYVRGAPAIGATGAFGMALAAQNSPATDRDSLLADLSAAKELLDAARPTAVNLTWATRRLLELAEQTVLPNVDDIRSSLLAEAQALADEDVEINRRMGFNGAAVIPDGSNLLHHCNTGALAAVDFGTALGVVFACHEQGKRIHVWVDETRPRLQGARLTAWELMRAEIPMHLIADNTAGHLMRTGKVDVVIFGADRVAANGDVANKIGTYKLAVVARENGIPVYCVAPTSTVDPNLAHGDLIPIEERGAEEVTGIGEKLIAPVGVHVYNPAFDVTPHRYLTGIVTEEGICYPPFTKSLAEAVGKAQTRVEGNRKARGK